MTMQVGMKTLEKKFALVGDTKCRVTEATSTVHPFSVPSTILSHSKIAISEPHQIAVAVAGNGDLGGSPEKELANHLSKLTTICEGELGSLLQRWGEDYFTRHSGGRPWQVLMHTMLILNPNAEYAPFLKLRIGQLCSGDRSERYMVNGNEDNTAIFWPEFFKCDKRLYSLEEATSIAAFTVSIAAELNPYGVSGLEIWQFDEKWQRLSIDKVEEISSRLDAAKEFIAKSVLQCSKRDPLAPLP
jgi:hypothetical protein